MCHRDGTAGGEGATHRARAILFRDQHRIPRHASGHAPLALVRRLARGHDRHRESSDAAIGRELDLRVSLPYPREAIDLVARHGVPTTRHALDRYRVAAESRNEPVSFGGPAVAARAKRGRKEDETPHSRRDDGAEY